MLNKISNRFSFSSRLRNKKWVNASLVVAVVLSMFISAVGVFALVPAFPDNIVVFPNRDFISVEGYEDHAGEIATLELTRPGVGIIGSAQAVVSAGGVAFEINHPGGFCWGNGTSLKVTPDMLPGDIASIRFGNTPAGDVRVLDAFVTNDSVLALDGLTVTVSGHIGSGVNRDNTEQRIVEPGLTDTPVGKRDVRAIPGPLTPSANGSYSSSLEFFDNILADPNDDTFLATYIFLEPETAAIAANAGLGERLLSWEEVDVDANRQGITIAEFGEPGGPGFGGCPNGPLQSGPPGPTNVVAALQANGNIIVTWTPAVGFPGTPAISGYRVHAVAQTVSGNEQIEIGKRINGQAATGTTITGLSASETYDIEVVSVSSVGETFPAIHASAPVDNTPPVVSANSAGGNFAIPQVVTLSANEAGSQIFFTLDGTSPLDLGSTSVTAILFTAPITISTNSTLQFVAFDLSGNISEVGSLDFVITNTPTPAAPTFGLATVGNGSVSLTWTNVPADPSITGYGVQVYDLGGVAFGALNETAAQSLTISGLAGNTSYDVTVKAQNVNGYGPESAKLRFTTQGAVIANAGPDQSVTRSTTATTVNLTGAGSTTVGATYLWQQIGASPADTVVIANPTQLNTSFSLPLYTFPQTNNPKVFRLTVTTASGSISDEVQVALITDRVTITNATYKANDFRVSGTCSLVGTTVRIHRGGLTGPVVGTTLCVAGNVFDLRLRNAATPTPAVLTITVESTAGGTVATPFTVAQR